MNRVNRKVLSKAQGRGLLLFKKTNKLTALTCSHACTLPGGGVPLLTLSIHSLMLIRNILPILVLPISAPSSLLHGRRLTGLTAGRGRPRLCLTQLRILRGQGVESWPAPGSADGDWGSGGGAGLG